MKKLLIILLVLVLSCSTDNTKIIIIEKLDAFKTLSENRVMARDIVSYNYPQLFYEETNIKDIRLKGNVSHDYVIDENNRTVKFRLILQNESRELENDLTKFFKNYVSDKKKEHKEKTSQFNNAIEKAIELIELIEKNDYDSIIDEISPNLKAKSSVDDFILSLKKREDGFINSGIRKLMFKQTYSSAGQFKGEFYAIYFEYSNGIIEHITLENYENQMKLLGYNWYRKQP